MKTRPFLKLHGVREIPQGKTFGNAFGHLRFFVYERTKYEGETEWRDRVFFPLEGLVISCQIDGTRPEKEPAYAFEIGWDNRGPANYYELKGHLKALAPIVGKFLRSADQFGTPQTFGAFVAMAAAAVGVQEIVLQPIERHDDPRTISKPAYAIGPIDAEVLRIFNACRACEGKEPVAA